MRLKIFFTFFSFTISISAQTVMVDSFYAPSLKRMKTFSVILPEGYSKNVHHPVLYLLHGYGGNHQNWLQLSKIKEYVKDLPLIVILPNAENSWYVNSFTDTLMRYEDFIMKDLLKYIRTQYSIDIGKQAIAGLSMGGYGSVMLSLKNPAVFRFAGSLSGAITVPGDLKQREQSVWGKNSLPSLKKTFGFPVNPESKTYDVFHLSSTKKADSTTYYYITVGINDGFVTFLGANRALADSLRVHKIPYEYHEVPGGHNWKFWDREIQSLLRQLRIVLGF
jgi:S-formylglutathione hydrolase FrmB